MRRTNCTAMKRNGINTWDNQHCDLLLNKIGPDEDGVNQKQAYVTMGDTWVITWDTYGNFTLEQLTLAQAARRVRRQLNGPAWQLEAMPDDVILRLYGLDKLDPMRLPHD